MKLFRKSTQIHSGQWYDTAVAAASDTGCWKRGRDRIPTGGYREISEFGWSERIVQVEFYMSVCLLLEKVEKICSTYSFHQAFQRWSLEHQGIKDFFWLLPNIEQHWAPNRSKAVKEHQNRTKQNTVYLWTKGGKRPWVDKVKRLLHPGQQSWTPRNWLRPVKMNLRKPTEDRRNESPETDSRQQTWAPKTNSGKQREMNYRILTHDSEDEPQERESGQQRWAQRSQLRTEMNP